MDNNTKQILIEDAMVLMSGDMFSKVYELESDFVFVTNCIKSWVREFIDLLISEGYDIDGNDEKDFIFELEKFEECKFNELKKYY